MIRSLKISICLVVKRNPMIKTLTRSNYKHQTCILLICSRALGQINDGNEVYVSNYFTSCHSRSLIFLKIVLETSDSFHFHFQVDAQVVMLVKRLNRKSRANTLRQMSNNKSESKRKLTIW